MKVVASVNMLSNFRFGSLFIAVFLFVGTVDYATAGFMDSLKKSVESVGGPDKNNKASASKPEAAKEDPKKIEYLTPKLSSAHESVVALQAGEDIDPATLFTNDITGKDKVLFLMERGRINQIFGNIDASKTDFEAAIQAIKEDDSNSGVSAGVGSAADQVSATIVNDNMIPYTADGYERVMLHHFQAMNYLFKNDLEGAGVEVRLANAEQEAALKRHEAEVEKAKTEAEKEKIKVPLGNENIGKALAVMDQAAGKVKSSFQNAYTFYASGIIYEIYGEPNDAYIDYKKALEINPENYYIQKDVLRLAKRLDMADDLDKFKAAYPQAYADMKPSQEGDGELIVFLEDGFVSPKSGVAIPIPIILPGIKEVAAGPNLTMIAVPVYNSKLTEPASFPVTVGSVKADAKVVCLLDALAARALKEEMPAIITRQTIRAALKGAAAVAAGAGAKAAGEHVFGKKAGNLAALGASTAVSAVNVLTEQVDSRSWESLPNNCQIIRLPVPSGVEKATLPCGTAVDVKPGVKNVIRVIRFGNITKTTAVRF